MENAHINDVVPSLQAGPEPSVLDHSIAVAKVAALAFPFLGPGVALVDLITAPLRTKRLNEWLEQLRLQLNELSKTVATLTPSRLAEDEAFNTACFQALQSVLRAHQKEKLDALRNAVVNIALGREVNADRQAQFLALVDRFTAAHLILLRFFQDPAGHFQRRCILVPTVSFGTNLLADALVYAALPELHQQLQSTVKDHTASASQLLQVLLDDLVNAGLISLQRVKGGDGWLIPKFAVQPTPYPVNSVITHLGEDFLAFITETRDVVQPTSHSGSETERAYHER